MDMNKIKQLKKNKKIKLKDLYKIIILGKNVLHILASRGEYSLIHKLVKKFPKYNPYITDDNGNTIFHIMIKNGFFDEKLFNMHTESLIMINNKNESVIYLMSLMSSFDKDIFSKYFWIAVDMYPKILEAPTFELDAHLLKAMCDNYSNRFIKKIMKIVFDKYININDTRNMKLFYFAIQNNQLELFNLLLSYVKDINKIFANQATLLYDIIDFSRLDMLKSLLKKFPQVCINTCAINVIYDPISLLFYNFNNKIWKLIKNKNIDYEIKDKKLNTIAHNALKSYISIPEPNNTKKIAAIKYILEKSDLSDINSENKTPLDLIKNNKLEIFYDVIYKINNSLLLSQSKLPINLTNDYTGNKNSGIFGADYLHELIYIYIYLSKYKNITILYQDDDKKEFMDKLKIYRINLNTSQARLYNLIELWADCFYEIFRNIIMWNNRDYYYINDKFDFYLNKAVLSLARFVFIPITFITPPTLHAGCILYDKLLNKVIRFEPYGLNNICEDGELFDQFIKDKFETALGKKVLYLKPEDYMKHFKLQYISDETNIYNNFYGDPGGYCLAWCFWWIGLKVLNPDMDDSELLKNKNEYITKHDPNIGNSYMIHIRSFANKLYKYKNKFLEEIGIDKLSFNRKLHNSHDINKITNILAERIPKLLST